MPCPTDWRFQFETTEAAGNTDDDEDGGLAMDWLRPPPPHLPVMTDTEPM